jgi:uncharacterized membrane protein
MRIENSIEIAAPLSRVWDLTIDVESWPEHTPTVTSVELLDDGPLTVGSTARIKQPAQRAKRWTVTAFEPQRRFAWATRTLGATMTGSHLLAESPSGTTNTLVIDIEGPLARVLTALAGPSIRKALSAENQGFKAAAEA